MDEALVATSCFKQVLLNPLSELVSIDSATLCDIYESFASDELADIYNVSTGPVMSRQKVFTVYEKALGRDLTLNEMQAVSTWTNISGKGFIDLDELLSSFSKMAQDAGVPSGTYLRFPWFFATAHGRENIS